MKISADALRDSQPLLDKFVEAIRDIIQYKNSEFSSIEEKTSVTETLRVLNNYYFDRCQGCLGLLINGFVWDAEIILRSAYEAFSKIILISTAEISHRDGLAQEFWTDLSAIYDRKGAQKSQPAEALVTAYSEDDARVFRSLRNERLFQTDPKGNKRSRKEIEQRWSFSGIIETVSKEGHVGKLVGFDSLAHAYSIGSHIAHASPKAFDLLEDRTLRGDDLIALEVGHLCRMLSDMISLACISLYFSRRVWIDQINMPGELDTAFSAMNEATKPYQERFHRSQDDFYERWQSD